MSITTQEQPSSIGWRCSGCRGPITRIEDGWVEWLASEDDQRRTRIKGLRLVHRSGDLRGRSCQYDGLAEFRRDGSLVEGLSLERFVGPDGLMLLLSMIGSGEMPKGEVVELLKRVQVPGYELVRDIFPEAVEKGIVAPSIGKGYLLQSEIYAVLHWKIQQDAGKSAA
jgi:hypothetical protein